MSKRILVLSAAVGAGHMRAAQAVELALRQLDPATEVKNVDVLTLTNAPFRKIYGEAYLDNLQTALQRLMDEGQAVLVPSYRPTGVKQVLVGDRLKDPNWASINVNVDHFLPAPVGKIAGLSLLWVEGAKLSLMLQPAVKEYTVTLPHGTSEMKLTAEPTATHSTMTLDGKPMSAGQAQTVALSGNNPMATVIVTSPDGSAQAKYVVKIEQK